MNKFKTNIDLDGNEIQSFLIHKLSSDPVSPTEALFWYNTTTKKLKYYDGTTVHTLGILGDPASAGGDVGRVQYNDAGSLNGADSVGIHDTELILYTLANPSTPPAGTVKLYSREIAGRHLLSQKSPNGLDFILQSNLFRNAVYIARPVGNSTTVTLLGGVALSATGTATAASVAVTNLHTQMRRVEYLVTTAAATAVAGFRANSQQFFRGTNTSEGGFFFVGRWGIATGATIATTRASFGLHANQTAPTDVNPSTIINQLAMGWDSGDTNIQMMHNSGSGTATKIDLGVNFPRPTTDRTKVYELALFCPSGGSSIYYQIMDLTTGSVASGVVSTNIPANTILMHLKGWCSVGGTSSVIGISFFSAYIETDN